MRYMSIYKPGYENDAPPTEENIRALGNLIEEMAKAGTLLLTDGLQPSKHGARVKISGGRFTVTDGPFAEAKELVGGFAIVNVASKEEAIEVTKRFLAIVGEGESEIRLMHDAPAYAHS